MDVLARVAPFFLLIAFGAVAARTKLLDLGGARALSTYVFWIAFPALLIHSLSHAPPPDVLLARGLAVYALVALVPLLAIPLLGRALGWSREARAGSAAAAISSNTPFLGAPLAVSLFGAAAAPSAAALIAIDCSLTLILSTAMLRSAAPGGTGAQMARLIATHPLILSALLGVGMAYAGVLAPGPVDQTLGILSVTASPVGLVALGVVMGLELGKIDAADAVPAFTAVAVKLLLMPALVWFATGLAGADPLFRATATLVAGSPVAVMVFIQTRTLNVFARGGAIAVVFSTLAAVATLTLLGLTLR